MVVVLAVLTDLVVHLGSLLVRPAMYDCQAVWARLERALASLDRRQLSKMMDQRSANILQNSGRHGRVSTNILFLTFSSVTVQLTGKGPENTP